MINLPLTPAQLAIVQFMSLAAIEHQEEALAQEDKLPMDVYFDLQAITKKIQDAAGLAAEAALDQPTAKAIFNFLRNEN